MEKGEVMSCDFKIFMEKGEVMSCDFWPFFCMIFVSLPTQYPESLAL